MSSSTKANIMINKTEKIFFSSRDSNRQFFSYFWLSRFWDSLETFFDSCVECFCYCVDQHSRMCAFSLINVGIFTLFHLLLRRKQNKMWNGTRAHTHTLSTPNNNICFIAPNALYDSKLLASEVLMFSQLRARSSDGFHIGNESEKKNRKRYAMSR